MKIAALQLPTQPASNARLDYYLKLAADKGAQLAVCGEYVLNDFFTALQAQSAEQIAEQSRIKADFLQDFSRQFDLAVLAPIITRSKAGLAKQIGYFSAGRVRYFAQQILMPYAHWNEAKFFANEPRPLKPVVLRIAGLRVGVLPSFEAHFDESFARLKCDLIVVFCAHTFESDERWRCLLRARAFCANASLLRINRTGSEGDWEFYGGSFLADANGAVTHELGRGEEMLLLNVGKASISKCLWQFERIRKEIAARK